MLFSDENENLVWTYTTISIKSLSAVLHFRTRFFMGSFSRQSPLPAQRQERHSLICSSGTLILAFFLCEPLYLLYGSWLLGKFCTMMGIELFWFGTTLLQLYHIAITRTIKKVRNFLAKCTF